MVEKVQFAASANSSTNNKLFVHLSIKSVIPKNDHSLFSNFYVSLELLPYFIHADCKAGLQKNFRTE
jgi:hypothetical protein